MENGFNSLVILEINLVDILEMYYLVIFIILFMNKISNRFICLKIIEINVFCSIFFC